MGPTNGNDSSTVYFFNLGIFSVLDLSVMWYEWRLKLGGGRQSYKINTNLKYYTNSNHSCLIRICSPGQISLRIKINTLNTYFTFKSFKFHI